MPINLVFDENTVVASYFNPVSSIYEIWSIEAYHTKIEISFLRILEDYYFNQKEETRLNYYDAELQSVFLQQVYGFPLGAKFLGISKSKKLLTKKNLIVITTSN